MQSIEAVIFDLEGTLFHSSSLSKQHLRALIHLVAKRRDISTLSAKWLFNSKKRKLTRHLGYVPTTLATACHLGIRLSELYRVIERIDPKIYVKPSGPLREMLVQLRRRCKIALLTNMSGKTTEKILSALGLERTWFDVIVTGDIVSELKPAEEPFIVALCLLGVPSQNAVMVGDRISVDLIPAKKLGMRTLLIGKKESASEYVDVVADDITHLPKALQDIVH